MVSNIVASTLPKRLTTSAAPSLLSRLWTPAADSSGVAPGRPPLYLKPTFTSGQRASPAARRPSQPPLDIPYSSSRTSVYRQRIKRILAGRSILDVQPTRSKTPISSQSRRPSPVKKTDSATVEQITEGPARTTPSSSAPRQRPAPLFLNRPRSSSAPARLERKSFTTKHTQPSQALRRSKRVQFADEGFVLAEVRYFVESDSIDASRRLQRSECDPLGNEYEGYTDDETGRHFEVIGDKDQPIPQAPRRRQGRTYNPCCYEVAARGGFEMPVHYEYKRIAMPSPRCLKHAIVERLRGSRKVFTLPETSDMPSPPTSSTTSDNSGDGFGFTDVF